MPASLLQHPFMSQSALAETDSESMVQAMLTFELGLAEVQEARGAVPAGASRQMRDILAAHAFDVEAIAAGIASGGNAAIPFVKQGRAALPDELKRYFHQGATSQDVVDSALMLLLKPRLAALDLLLVRCRIAAITLMEAHAGTAMVGRTLMQQALPITFGVKVAHWAIGLEQARRRLAGVELPVQFGGAVGVHSGWEVHGVDPMTPLVVGNGVKRDLERVCSLCPHKTRCARVLADGPEPEACDFCPNAGTLEALGSH